MKFIFGLLIVTLFVCYANSGKNEKVHIKIIVPKLIKKEKHTKTVYIHKHDKKKDDDHGHDDHDKDKKQHHVVHHYHYHKAQHDHKGSQKHHHDLKHAHNHKGSHEHKGHLGHDHKGKFSHDNNGKLSHSHTTANKKEEGHGYGHGGHKSHKLVYVDNFNQDDDDHGEFNQYEGNSREDNLDKDNYHYYKDKPNPTSFFDGQDDNLSHKSLRQELVEVSKYHNPNRIVFNHEEGSPLSKLLTVTSGYQVEEDQPHDLTTNTYNHFNGLGHYSEDFENDHYSSDGDFEESQDNGRLLDSSERTIHNSDAAHFRHVDALIEPDADSSESEISTAKLLRFGYWRKA